MEQKEEVYYVYRHIRLDTKEVFYIGLGKVYNLNTKAPEKYYSRAFQMTKRNRFWQFVKDKTEIEIEVIFETNSREIVKEKEIEFISLYGRRDLGKGSLVNMSDGGDGMTNNKQSEETLEKRRQMYKEGKTGLKALKGEEHPRSQKVIETKTGKIFDSKAAAANYLGISPSDFSDQLINPYRKNNTGFLHLDSSLDVQYIDRRRNVKIYDYSNKSTINSIAEASRIYKISHRFLARILDGKYKNTTSLVYYEDYLKGVKPNELYISKRKDEKVINTENNEIFSCMSKVSRIIGMSKSAFENRMKGKIFNETPYQLLKDYEKDLEINWNVKNKKKPEKKVIDEITLRIYNSIGEAAKELDINYNTFANYLNPKSTNSNKTNIIYLSDYKLKYPNFQE